MKTIIIWLFGLTFFVSVGGVIRGPQAAKAEATPVQNYELATSESALIGAWYGFPTGMFIRFAGDGRATFGQADGEQTGGTDAVVRFDGTRLTIVFSDYDGESEICKTAVGTYQVHLLDDGNIRFAPLDDACQFRVSVLNGHADLDFERIFHPLN